MKKGKKVVKNCRTLFFQSLIFDSDILICFQQPSACHRLKLSKLLLVLDSYDLKWNEWPARWAPHFPGISAKWRLVFSWTCTVMGNTPSHKAAHLTLRAFFPSVGETSAWWNVHSLVLVLSHGLLKNRSAASATEQMVHIFRNSFLVSSRLLSFIHLFIYLPLGDFYYFSSIF